MSPPSPVVRAHIEREPWKLSAQTHTGAKRSSVPSERGVCSPVRDPQTPNLVGFLMYCIVLVVAVLLLSIYHTVIVLQNLTTNEHVRNYYRDCRCAVFFIGGVRGGGVSVMGGHSRYLLGLCVYALSLCVCVFALKLGRRVGAMLGAIDVDQSPVACQQGLRQPSRVGPVPPVRTFGFGCRAVSRSVALAVSA